MSYIQQTIKCILCGKEMNIATGTFGSGIPKKCPQCNCDLAYEVISDGWIAKDSSIPDSPGGEGKLLEISEQTGFEELVPGTIVFKNGRETGLEEQFNSATPQSNWGTGCLTFDEIKNILDICNADDVETRIDYLTISFVPKNVTGKAWKELREKMLLITKK